MNELLLPEQVKAARALLAWSQQELASKANVATSTLADFERGFRTPVANNAQAIRDALEAEGLQFIAGGVVERGMLQPPENVKPGSLMRWINATHLSQWGERRDGQSGIPELLRRLIFATVGPAAKVHFPSDESVQYPGWDGECKTSLGLGFVPEGDSVWEIGAQRTSIRAKAEEDFNKRSGNPLGYSPDKTTYVFVTPQRFPGKNKWVEEKKALNIWLNVCAIDADDLVHWLEIYPAVAQWLSVKIGHRPQGLRNIEESWSEWIHATRTPLTPDVILAGRDEEQTKVLRWLRDSPQQLSVQAEAPDEALAFLYASISPLPEEHKLFYWSKCVVVDNATTARQLAGLGTPLIIVLTISEPGIAQSLVNNGHHVYAIYGSDVSHLSGHSIRLPRPWRFELKIALTHAGLNEEDAHRYAHASGRSITVLRRLMPIAPNYKPQWAEHVSSELIAAMFAGSWDETSSQDQKIISELAGCSYEQVEEILAPLASTFGGPLIRSGNLWRVVSLRDLWTQVGNQLTSHQLKRFENTFHSVVSAIDPYFETQPNADTFYEDNSVGKPSGSIRRGLTESMIALAVFPEVATLITDVSSHVNSAVYKLLNNATEPLWWSLSQDFHNLAEAAPTVFLDAVEAGLEGDSPQILSLFRSDEGIMQPTEYLSNLLWALEMLARSPRYLMQSALLLAWLDDVDPGGRWGNRPAVSLRRIFVSWSPQTYANSSQRIKVIDRIISLHPIAGWKLLLALAPRSHDTSEPSSMPNWRDFTPNEPESITWSSVATAACEIGERLLMHINGRCERWFELFHLWGNFDSNWKFSAAKQLADYSLNLTSSDKKERLWNELRHFLQRNRGFKDAPWALSEEELAPLDAIFLSLTPENVEERFRWLFCAGANELGENYDWQTQRNRLEERQLEAVEFLLAELEIEQIFHFSSTITLHYDFGLALARSSTKCGHKHFLMKKALMSGDSDIANIGLGILYGLKATKGSESETWVQEIWEQAITDNWGELAEVRIAQVLPPVMSLWLKIESRPVNISTIYWKTIPTFRLSADLELEYVIDHLLLADRSHDALAWLANNIKIEPEGSVIIRVMHTAASTKDSSNNDNTMSSYYIGILLDYLESDVKTSKEELVRLEWIYFQVLRYSRHPARNLHQALAKDPVFFTSLMKLLYLPEEDSGVVESEPANPKQARDLASQAYQVLHDWAIVPGTDENGTIDSYVLMSWVKQARQLLKSAGRGDIGDDTIGMILSAAKRKKNETWPPEAIREVLEFARSRAMESGFEVGVYNRRGVTVRMPHDGGGQERILVERYKQDADDLRFEWPRTAACLDRIAISYQQDAIREDHSADQGDWL
ncbi:helix-turn-helix transcriptional regulator [Salmonella enterica]|nr:helix-turn-helix transcriptional regulator [Salmonella enterica]ELP5614572.1 helix-turn-helix transcriptional regulator [Salmonella enterica]